jgi:hypothetical protein
LTEACCKTNTDGIGDEEHHDRYLGGRVLGGARGLGTEGDDEIGFRLHKIGGERRQPIEAETGFLTLDDDGGTLDPAELTKLVKETVVNRAGARGGAQHSHARYLRCRLGGGRRREDKQHNQKDRQRSGKSSHSNHRVGAGRNTSGHRPGEEDVKIPSGLTVQKAEYVRCATSCIVSPILAGQTDTRTAQKPPCAVAAGGDQAPQTASMRQVVNP